MTASAFHPKLRSETSKFSRRRLISAGTGVVLTSLVGTKTTFRNPKSTPPGWLTAAPGRISAENILTPAGMGDVRFAGALHNRIQACIKNLTMAQSVDRLVAPFRTKADSLDFQWRGEFWGKWFDAAAMAYGYDPRPEYRLKLDEAVSKLLATASPDGYIGTYLPKNEVWGLWDVWNRKYTLLGLLDYYDITGDKNVLTAAARSLDHLISQIGPGKINIADVGYPHLKGDPPSSILAMVVMLYERTGKTKYLQYAQYIVDQWSKPSKLNPKGMRLIQDALAKTPPKDINFPKAYELTSCYEGVCELYRVTQRKEYLDAALLYAKGVIRDEIMIHGSGSASEDWCNGRKIQSSTIQFPVETCVTETWMRYCFHLLQLTGDPLYAEQMENALRNALLASLTPNGDWFGYFGGTLSGQRVPSLQQCTGSQWVNAANQQSQQFNVTNNVVTSCCVCNGQRGLMLTPYWAVMNSAAGDVVINLYNAGHASVRLPSGNKVKLIQTTDYPLDGRVVITVHPGKSEVFSLLLRIPSWSKRSHGTINGAAIGEPLTPGRFARIYRRWKSGDKIVLGLDMRCRVVSDPGGGSAIALARGPLILAMDNRLIASRGNTSLTVRADADGYLPTMPFLKKARDNTCNLICSLPFYANDGSAHMIPLCDYASAGNLWTTQSLFRVWLPQPLNLGTLWQGITPVSWLTYTPFRSQVPTRFITQWLFSGPYEAAGKSNEETLDMPFAPEAGNRSVNWKSVAIPAGNDSLLPYFVNLRKLTGTSNKIAYLKTIVEVPVQQAGMLMIGSTAGVKVWLNGALTYQGRTGKGFLPDQVTIPVKLRRGKNTLLLKVMDGEHGWSACARFLPTPEEGEIVGTHGSIA